MIQGLPFKLSLADTGYFSLPDLITNQKLMADKLLESKLRQKINDEDFKIKQMQQQFYPMLQQSLIEKNNSIGQSRGYRDNLYAQKVQAEIANAMANKMLKQSQMDLVGENIKGKKIENQFKPDYFNAKIGKLSKKEMMTDESPDYKISDKDKLKLNDRLLTLQNLQKDVGKFAESGAPIQFLGVSNLLSPNKQAKYKADVAGLSDRIAKAFKYLSTERGLQGAYTQLERGKGESYEGHKKRLSNLVNDLGTEINNTKKLLTGNKDIDVKSKKTPKDPFNVRAILED